MPDQNQQQTQTQNPQTQWTVQNQDTNKDFDMFGWDSDIFESENLIPIDGEWEINRGNNDDFDDDIDVDYRDEWNFSTTTTDTPQTQTTSNTNDLWDFDFSEAINPDQSNSSNNNPNNDLWSSDFEPTIPATEMTQTDDIWDDFGVYDEPDNPDDYVSPDDIGDDITDLDDDITNIDWESQNINTDKAVPDNNLDDITDLDDDTTNIDWRIQNMNTDKAVPDNDLLDLDENEVSESINENTPEIPPMKPQEIQTINNEISTPEIEILDESPKDMPETNIDRNINGNADGNVNVNIDEDEDENNDILYSDTDDLDDYNEWNETITEDFQSWSPDIQIDTTNYERDDDKTQIQNKFLELKFETEKIFQLVKKDYNIWFDILWANDDRQKIMYKLFIQDNAIDIQKNITDKLNNANTSHSLRFELDDTTLKTYIDNELLYDEITDLQNDNNKNKQVVEKLNKFIFLITEEYKKIIKDKKAKDHENIKKATFREF